MRTFLNVLGAVFLVGLCVALGAVGGCYTGLFVGGSVSSKTTEPEPLNIMIPWMLGLGVLGAGLGLAGGMFVLLRKVKKEK